jgi:hypothetical protein
MQNSMMRCEMLKLAAIIFVASGRGASLLAINTDPVCRVRGDKARSIRREKLPVRYAEVALTAPAQGTQAQLHPAQSVFGHF